jgi:hypothetical protein
MSIKHWNPTAILALIALAALPYGVNAAVTHPAPVMFQAGTFYNYQFTVERADGMGFPRTGTMRVRFSSDNIISGNYTYETIGIPNIPVTGGRTGNEFWMDLGSSTLSLLHVSGTIQPDGSLKGYAFSSRRSNPIYNFTAKLIKK